jgi:uncharacterized iron-regulated protein
LRNDSAAALALSLAAALAAVTLAGCAPAAPPPRPAAAAGPWQTTLDVAHPLVGKVWDARHHKFTGPDDVFAALAEADFVLLGEKHDNPDHHALQARALREMIARGKAPAVAFEMLDEDQQPTVDAYLAAPGATAAGFGPHVDWDDRGWHEYGWYAPIVEAAMGAHLPIVATNLVKKELRAIVHGGAAAMNPARAKELGLDVQLPDAQTVELQEEMRASHCGQLPDEMLGPMATAQRARDGALGSHMLAAAAGPPKRPVVLVAGNGHARTDRGVPAYLYAHAPGAKVVSVGFLEVDHAKTAPEPEPYDFVWYTPRASDDDPCAKMMMR